MVWSPKTLLSGFYSNYRIEDVLYEDYKIYEGSVENINKTKAEDGSPKYHVQFKQDFVNKNLMKEFCSYNNSYICMEDDNKLTVLRSGSKSDLPVAEIGNTGSYEIVIEYFNEDEIQSESTASLVMLSEFFQHRNKGNFAFTELNQDASATVR